MATRGHRHYIRRWQGCSLVVTIGIHGDQSLEKKATLGVISD